MYFLIFLASLILQVSSAATTMCSSYSMYCEAALGHPFAYYKTSADSTTDIIELMKDQHMYFGFEFPLSKTSVDIITSRIFGNVQIYVAFNREPTKFDYDYCSSDFEDIVGPILHSSIYGTAALPSEGINVLIVATSQARIRVLASTFSVASVLTDGIPQLDSIVQSSSQTKCYSFTPLTAQPRFVTLVIDRLITHCTKTTL